MRADLLTHRIELQESVKTPSGGGGFSVDWVTQATVAANRDHRYRANAEVVVAGARVSSPPVIWRIRRNAVTKAVTANWRVVDADGGPWNIRAVHPTQDRAFLELHCEGAKS